MKRRKFVQTCLPLFLAPSWLAHSCRQPSPRPSNGKKVIIVGAGIAGLTAANQLKTQGFDVLVLESQEKVGGRLRTRRGGPIPFDEGASWIHGTHRNPITTLAEQAGMRTFETLDEHRISYDLGGIRRSAAVYDQEESKFEQILDRMMRQGHANQSFETVFSRLYPSQFQDRLWRFFLSSYVTFDLGDLDQLSSLLYQEGKVFSGPEKIAVNGYDTLAHYLAKDIRIRLNDRVTHIDFSTPRVQVHHSEGISEADFVLVTVPLGVLKSGQIQFTPSLPSAKLEAIKKVGMNCVNKFLLTFPITFWENVQYISYTPAIRDKFNYFLNVNTFHPNAHALMTFAYAEEARRTEKLSDQEVTEEIMRHVKDMYGNSIPAPLNLQRTRWQSNENAYGSYSYPTVSTEMHHFDQLAESINDQLFFAGEHTEKDYFSTVHGAYLSGLREAEKISSRVD